MKLNGNFTVTITGNTDAFTACARDIRNLDYVLHTLFSGGEVAVSELESWGLEVRAISADAEPGQS